MILRNGTVVTKVFLKEHQGKSEVEIAGILGISRNGLWKLRKRMGYPDTGRSDKGVLRVSLEDQKERRNAYHREYNREWSERTGGYVGKRVGKKTYHWHRLIAERALGRPLESTEVVHHINGNPQDNRNGNLVICTQDYHLNVLHG